MKKLTQRRMVILIAVIGVIFVLLAVRLFDLMYVHGEEYAEASDTGMRRTLRVTGNRGKILDADGVVLAYDRESYNVTYAKDPSEVGESARREVSQILTTALSIIRDHGGKPACSGYLTVDEEGSPVFDWGVTEESAVESRRKAWNTAMLPSASERKKMSEYDWETAEGIMAGLRVYYGMPEELTDEEAAEVLAVWQQVQYNAYKSYIPITIAKNVSLACVSQIELAGMELEGVAIEESSIRVYPRGELASHIVGYLGRMSDSYTIAGNEQLGYSQDDLVGVAGIESTMESYLTGNTTAHSGERVVEVNSLGKIIREFPELSTDAVDGNDVQLSIRTDLQSVLETALAENIASVRAEQEEKYEAQKETYDEKLEELYGGRDLQFAEYGAAVVMEVKTGKVLAMASYPGYDPNLFITGISSSEYAEMFAENELKPLLNKAISSRGTPGSVYKMGVGLAALMSVDENGDPVITTETTISDEGMFTKHLTSDTATGPRCWVRPNYEKHADLTLTSALKVSCNYFFYDIAYRMGIDQMDEWLEKLGLGTTTGVELPGEVSCQIANQESLYDPEEAPSGVALLVYNKIVETMRDACATEEIETDDDTLNAAATSVMALVGNLDETREYGADVRRILRNDVGLSSGAARTAGSTISALLYEVIWNDNRTITAGIGQDVTLVTPIGLARYVSALVNGGKVYNASVVSKVIRSDGTTLEEREPELVRELDVPEEYLEAIKEGMREVVSLEDGGTAGKAFDGFKYRDEIGGKTGTGQVSQIDLENNSWMTVFAPYDDPEICVVVYIPNGIAGDRSAYTIKKVVEYYLDDKYSESVAEDLPKENTLIP